MFIRNYRIFSLFGIPIEVNPTWLFTLAFFVYVLGGQLYPEALEDEPAWFLWALALVSGLLFFASIIVHELAHSLVAQRNGIPVRAITLFMLGGVSQITKEAKRPLVEFVTAIVGPLTSFALAAIFLGLAFTPGIAGGRAGIMFEFLFVMNLSLGVVNMAPGFPLDGGRVLRAAIWGITGNFKRATFLASICGRVLGFALMALGLLVFLRVFTWFDQFSGAWFVLVGLFLDNAARQAWTQVEVLETLRKYRASNVMRTMLPTVPETTTVLETVGRYFDPHFGLCAFIVDRDERVLGMLSDAEAARVPKDRWATTYAPQAMTPTSDVQTIGPEADLATALEQLESARQLQLPVVDAGRIVGYVSRMRIMNVLASERAGA
ncbi:MAG: site-2 protease family protein [Dehalococcoidia bacterium]